MSDQTAAGLEEPLLQGSRTAQGAFQTPVYKRPTDLANLVDETQRAAASSGLSHARKTDKGTEPYPTRAQIEQGALKGRDLELVYLTDPVELFFLISARVSTPIYRERSIH